MRNYYLILCVCLLFLAPCQVFGQVENITSVELTFTSGLDGSTVTASAEDTGSGLAVTGSIDLLESTDYDLSIVVSNTSGSLNETITASGENFLFFYSWTDEIFLSPAGDGNIDVRTDPVDYVDLDSDSLPIGLATNWTTDCGEEATSGSFRLVLQDQTGSKSDTSSANVGSAIFDLSWDVSVSTFPGAPPCENEEEIITDVVLAFVPTSGGDTIFAAAVDPDGEGLADLQVEDDVNLVAGVEYNLNVTLTNAIEGEDITEEIEEEDDEHQFFFEWTEGLFSDPTGNGNTDNRDDPVNYNDFDENSLPVGLSTTWTAGETIGQGSFRVVLKHQPDIKSPTTTVDSGSTDIDLTWNVNISPASSIQNVTSVELTFTSGLDGSTVTASAEDTGSGLAVTGSIDLLESTDYALSIVVSDSNGSLNDTITANGQNFLFFYGWTDEIFLSPAGDGNIDVRTDPVDYVDLDGNSLPIGLTTDWTTDCGEESTSGTFRIVLQDQTGSKTDSSSSDVGSEVFDLNWDVTVSTFPGAPPCENEEEIITDVVLAFVPTSGGDTIFAAAVDPDGEGLADLQVEDDINLEAGVEYNLSVTLTNSIEGEDITEEIEEEDDEHQFFFEWTEGLFSDPTGNGNTDNRDDPVNYNDFDENSLPVGLSTTWLSADTSLQGSFRVVLKHQPDIKSPTTTVDSGSTDIDLVWNVNIGITTSIKDLIQTTGLKVWPNPMNNEFRWELEGHQAEEMKMIDPLGRVVFVKNRPESTIQVSSLTKGTYILMISSKEHIWIERVVITD